MEVEAIEDEVSSELEDAGLSTVSTNPETELSEDNTFDENPPVFFHQPKASRLLLLKRNGQNSEKVSGSFHSWIVDSGPVVC